MDSFHPTLPVPPKDGIIVLPLGGCNQIGLNATLYGKQGPQGPEWILVDCGNGIGAEAPKNTNGLERQYPNFSVLNQLGKSLRACVITHAHEDHIGAINAYWPTLKCPIYAPNYAYAVLDGRFRRNNTRHCVNMLPYQPGHTLRIGSFVIDSVPVTHSTADSVALAIQDKMGTILHSGDWKMDPYTNVGLGTDAEKLKQIGDQGVRLLVNESTNANKEGRAGSEIDVLMGIEKIVKDAKGSVIISGFASNTDRVVAMQAIANRSERKVGVIGGSLDKGIAAAYAAGHLSNPDEYLDVNTLAQYPRNKQILLTTGAQGEPGAGNQRIIAGDTAFNIDGETTIILASSRIPGNEKQIDDMITEFKRMGATVYTRESEGHIVHVSGHGNADDYRDLYALTQPEALLPVHGGPEQRACQEKIAHDAGIKTVLNTLGDGVPLLVTKDNITELPPIIMQIWGGDDKSAMPKEDAPAYVKAKEEQEAQRPKKAKRPYTVRPRSYTPAVPKGRNANAIARDPERNRPRGPERHTLIYHPDVIEKALAAQSRRNDAMRHRSYHQNERQQRGSFPPRAGNPPHNNRHTPSTRPNHNRTPPQNHQPAPQVPRPTAPRPTIAPTNTASRMQQSIKNIAPLSPKHTRVQQRAISQHAPSNAITNNIHRPKTENKTLPKAFRKPVRRTDNGTER